ncbi:MAG: hypothetical protein M1836_002199 [Candelina mexicana]|nr:MAG: hypothetical protein M1836_002199 [Candelina mexicana]
MFNIIANLLSSIITILFPVFASYKALRTSDPAQLTPWLMYWVVLSCALLVEAWTEWVLIWYDTSISKTLSIHSLTALPPRIPFYPWIRLLLHFYLVLPQTQGARLLYQSHIHPFLSTYELEIDNFIATTHDRFKAAGLSYLKNLLAYIKETIFGLPPKSQPSHSPPPSAYGNSYVQNLFGRFNLPSAREGLAAPAGDFYGLLSAALELGGGERGKVEEMGRSGMLIPKGIEGHEERMSYIATQRDKLRILLQALDQEASNISTNSGEAAGGEGPGKRNITPVYGGGGLNKSKSESEFERVEHDEVGDKQGKRAASGGWMPWNWNTRPATTTTRSKGEQERATTSGADVNH